MRMDTRGGMTRVLLWLLVALHSLTHSATALLPHSTTAPLTLPAITHQWRPIKVRQHYNATGIPSQHPLSEDMLQRGMPALTPSQLHRLLPLVHSLSLQQREGERLLQLQKEHKANKGVRDWGGVSRRASAKAKELVWKRVRAQQKSNVTIASLGGSFARGTQCCVGYAWPHRVVEWLRRAYPLVKIIHLVYLKGSTSTLYGTTIVRELFDTTHVDLLLLGYALNDEVRKIAKHRKGFVHGCCLNGENINVYLMYHVHFPVLGGHHHVRQLFYSLSYRINRSTSCVTRHCCDVS
jgi:hypothetical protein